MMVKGHKSFRIDDLLCKKVNSEQKVASVPASNLTPSASPGSVASSPESSGMAIDLKSRNNAFAPSTSACIQKFFENPHHKSHSLPPSPVSSTSGAIGAAGDHRQGHGVTPSAEISSNNDSAINMSKHSHESRHGQAGGGLSARRHSHQNHHRGHYQGNDFHGLAYRSPNSPYVPERSTNESRGSSSSSRSGQTPTQTLTFYSPPSSTESVKPRVCDEGAVIIDLPTRGNQPAFSFGGLKHRLISNGNNGRGGSARSSPSDGRSSTNSFQETRHERHHEQQRQRQIVSSSSSSGHGSGSGVSQGTHHQSQQYKMNTILAQQLSAGTGNPEAGMMYGGQSPNANMAAAAAAAAAAASAGLMPAFWPNPFLSLPLIDPATGQPGPSAMLARHHHHQQQQQQQQHLQPHQQSIAERAALLFSLNNRFHPYGLPFGNARPTHTLLQVGSKRKGGQIRFSNSQTGQLEKSFIAQKYLNANDRKKLAHSLGLTDRQVKTWFQNRRAKWRKSKECINFEAESHISGSSYNGRLDDSPDDGTCDSMVSMD